MRYFVLELRALEWPGWRRSHPAGWVQTQRKELAMRKTMSAVAACILAIGSLAFAQEKDTTSLDSKQAPDFSLNTPDGKTLKLSDQKGKVVVLDLWATWCPPCRKSLPHLQSISVNKELADKGLVVWAVNQQEKPEVVKEFVEKNSYSFTVLMDTDGKMGKSYLVRGIPTTVVVGRDGTVSSVFIGFGDGSEKKLDDAVEKALAQK